MLDAVDTFQRITGYPLVDYLQQVAEFLTSGYAPLQAYYAGSGAPDPVAYTTLTSLREQARRVAELYRLHRRAFQTYGDWQLLEQLENAETRLHTIAQLGKYLRSGRTNAGAYRAGTSATYTPGRGTLEQVAREVTGGEDDWQQIALDNQLGELDYTSEGRVALHLTLPEKVVRRQRDVLGPATGELALGRDFPHRLGLNAVTQDLVVNSPQQTGAETVDRLVGLRRGDIPELPDLGPRYEQVVGASAKLLGLPSVLRQLAEVLATDSTLAAFQTTGVSTSADQLTLGCTVATVYPLTNSGQTTLTLR